MYFFPAQQNNHNGEFAYTFFGLNEDVSKEEVKEALKNFTKGDNELLSMAKSYKLKGHLVANLHLLFIFSTRKGIVLLQHVIDVCYICHNI